VVKRRNDFQFLSLQKEVKMLPSFFRGLMSFLIFIVTTAFGLSCFAGSECDYNPGTVLEFHTEDAGLDLDKLSELEYAYCPAVSQAYDPLTKAVDLALRKKK